MGYRIGSGLAIIENQSMKKYQLCIVDHHDFLSVATFEKDEDAKEVFARIAEIQGISSKEAEMLEMFRGTSETMQKSITDILRVTQEDAKNANT